MIVERYHQYLGVTQACFAQNVGTGRVTQKGFEAKAAHDCYGFRIVIQYHSVEPACLYYAVDDLPKPTDSGNYDRALFIDFICLDGTNYTIHVLTDLIVGYKQKRGNQHRKRHYEKQGFCHIIWHNAGRDRKADEDKAKFTSLRQPQSKQPFVATLQFEQRAQGKQDHPLYGNHQQGHANDDYRIGNQKLKVYPGSDGDEEQTQQQPLERFEVGLEFVTKFAAGQDDTSHKRTKRGR